MATILKLLVCILLISTTFCLPPILRNTFLRRQNNFCGSTKFVLQSKVQGFLDCPDRPPDIDGATLSDVTFTGDGIPTATVTCDEGYLFPDLKPERVMTYECGKWRSEEQCQEVICPDPTIANAVIDPDPNPTYQHLDVINVTCAAGYVLEDGTDRYTAQCTKYRTWNNTQTCKTQICPTEARNNTMLKDDMLPDLGNSITLIVVCADGYLTSDAKRHYESSCGAEGWNHTDDCSYEVADACPETPVYNTMRDGDVIPLSVDGTVVPVACASGKDLPGSDTPMYYALCTKGVWNDTRSCGILNCDDALASNLPSGVYKIYPDPARTEMEVYCDLDDYEADAAWTIIQKRVDGMVDFNRNSIEYIAGFGDASGNFWLGLENMHILTDNYIHQLTVHLNLHGDSTEYYAHYPTFSVGSANTFYQLSVGNYDSSSNAGNGMFGHNGKPFSTFDDPRDTRNNRNCAEYGQGGWWFSDCGFCNLNGFYTDQMVTATKGIYWRKLTHDDNPHTSASFARMMLKTRGP